MYLIKSRGSGANKISIIQESDKDNKQIMLNLDQLRGDKKVQITSRWSNSHLPQARWSYR